MQFELLSPYAEMDLMGMRIPDESEAGVEADFNLISMTTRPSDNKVFAILMDQYNSGKAAYLCTINLTTGVVTNIGPCGLRVDGITWMPVGYFLKA